MSWRFLYLRDFEKLTVKLDNLLVLKDGEDYTVPLEDINTIMLEDNKGQITAKLLSRLSEYKIALVICNNRMMPCGIMLPFNQYHRSSKVAYKQICVSEELKNKLWSKIIEYKIYNQKEILKKVKGDIDAVKLLENYINQIQLGDKTNREGHAAKVYFNSLFGKKFVRHSEDVQNYALNYGYSIIRSNIARVVTMTGLIPNIGLHHKSELNNFNLVDDLIEPFRPAVDYIVATTEWENDFLQKNDKFRLINLINGTLEFNGSRYTLALCIEKFIHEIVRVIENEKGDIHRPKCELLKEDEL
ncbi:type II CRISPR-associated endonuclease Cas1 [Clostridium sp. M14]|uniref:type II CRISPR-associated endonuclease Cas1 n=1 Tax=Clostridium sp. M14 TaxID=2716311 RepID=UPI0013EE9B71|nr:type II CRISPR-associated endonuclease Cas1 [Clostridium sp. M14]MBZ9692413.1 type II CRISPR-associated endonuclease Cas1 [Clostridium sp. M14]